MGTRLCSRLTLFDGRDQSQCLTAELGTDTVHSWASCREVLLFLSPWHCLVGCLGGLLLPGAAPCPMLPRGCPGPGPHWPLWWLLWYSLKATADLPPARQGKNRCFHHGHLRSLNFLPLEPLPVLAW